jgi:hypothetical protein
MVDRDKSVVERVAGSLPVAAVAVAAGSLAQRLSRLTSGNYGRHDIGTDLCPALLQGYIVG